MAPVRNERETTRTCGLVRWANRAAWATGLIALALAGAGCP